MIKGEDLKRLINFSDAIVAVAITLLIIPLTDLFQDLSGTDLSKVLQSTDFTSRLSSFLISFFVIYSFWSSHRQILSKVKELSASTERYNFLWLLSIVLIPSATMINVGYSTNIGIYIYGIILIASIGLLQMIKKSTTNGVHGLESSILLLLICCLIILTIFPKIGHSIYYLLALESPVNHIKKRILNSIKK